MKIRKCESCGLGFPGTRDRCPHCDHWNPPINPKIKIIPPTETGLHIMSEDFVTAFELMEGSGYTDRSVNADELGDNYSIAAARHRYKKISAKIQTPEEIAFYADKNAAGEYELRDNTYGIVIYGLGGSRRYYVLIPSGLVCFSESHSSPERTEDAKALGFVIQ